MDAIKKALDQIRRTVPRYVLQVAFRDTAANWRNAPVSTEEIIMRDVIRSRVLVDANIVSGEEIVIPLDNIPGHYYDNFTVMYEIPPELVNNREIISVKSIGYLPYAVSFSSFGAGVGVVGPSGITDFTGAGQRVGDAASNIPPVSEAQVELVGYNTIIVRNFRRITAAYHLRCVIANEDNLANIHPRSYQAFANLCVLAVKSHIYNELIINMDRAYLEGGKELGSIRTWVENQADTEEQYQTYLGSIWAKVAFMNSATSHQRFIKSQINPGI